MPFLGAAIGLLGALVVVLIDHSTSACRPSGGTRRRRRARFCRRSRVRSSSGSCSLASSQRTSRDRRRSPRELTRDHMGRRRPLSPAWSCRKQTRRGHRRGYRGLTGFDSSESLLPKYQPFRLMTDRRAVTYRESTITSQPNTNSTNESRRTTVSDVGRNPRSVLSPDASNARCDRHRARHRAFEPPSFSSS